MIYSIIRKSDGGEIIRYGAASIVETINGTAYPLTEFDHVEYVADSPVVSATTYGGRRRLTKQEFIDLLGDAAVTFILSAAKTDIEVEKWVKRLDLTTPDPDGTSIDLDDPRTVAGVATIGAAMASLGVVSAEWVQGVLNG